MAKYKSESKKVTPNVGLRTSRYQYLALEDAEPNLGFATEKQLPLKSQYYQLVSFDGGTVYDRYWQVAPAGIITGISIFDEGFLVGVGNSVNKINFVGAAISATASGTISTITIFAPGNNKELIFNNNNEFGSSSNLTFDNSTGTLQINRILNVGSGGTIITNTLSGLVGIGTSNPTQNLHLNGNLRISGTVYDYYNQSGITGQLLIKNALGGLEWTNQGSIQAGAAGTYTNIQYQNYSGLLGGASNFVYEPITGRVGIGSTQPNNLLDVLGYSKFTGQTDINNLRVTGIATILNLGVTGLTTTQNLNVLGIATINQLGVSGIITTNNLQVVGIATLANLGVTGLTTTQNLNVLGIATINQLGVSGILTTRNLQVVGVTTVGFVTGTDAYFTGIVTATKFIGDIQSSISNFTNITVSGIATINQLGVSGLTTTRNLQVIGVSTLGIATASSITTPNLVVSGISTLNGAKINNVYVAVVDNNTISTPTGNLILDSFSGTTQINDTLYVNDSTSSTDSQSGAFTVNGGAGINQNLNVKGYVSVGSTLGVTGSSFLTNLNTTGVTTLASAGGITTTGGDLYIGGNLYTIGDLFYDELFARNGFFTGILSTRQFIATGVSTIATLGVSGLTTTRNLRVIGLSTFEGYLDANGGAEIDNIRIGVADDNTIDTSTGNLTLNSTGGTINVSTQVIVTGVTTFNSSVILGDASTDLVTFNSRINSNVFPSTNGTVDLGGSSNRWNNVYANTFNGSFVGTANKADALSTARTISVTGDLVYVSGAFDGTANVTGVGTLSNSGVTAGTYGSSTQVGIITVDAKGRITSASNQSIGFSSATVQNSDNLKTVTRSVNATHYLTFVDSDNNPAAYEAFYTDPDINYNPSSNVLSLSNVYVSGIATFAGNVDLGNDTSDLININGRVNTSIVPSSNGSYDLGSTSFKWNNIYANTFVGTITGNADSATQLANSRNFSISGDTSAPSVAFNGTANVNLITTLSNSGVTSNTYGSSTTVPVIAVDAKGRITSASNQGINFSAATVAQADKLTNSRNFSISGDTTAPAVAFDGTANVNLISTLSNSGVTSATYGSTTQVPQISVDSKGRITSATNVSINAGTLTGVIVTQTNYGCSNPISTSIIGGVTTIGIGTTSNAYGTRYISSGSPTGGCDGDLWYQTSSTITSDIPSGSVFYFASSTAPTGYLECNGAAISRTTYATLFAITGTTFGSGDGSTTFNLPDLRGEFIRGYDNGRGVDSGRVFGSSQTSQNLAHTHSITDPGHFHTVDYNNGAWNTGTSGNTAVAANQGTSPRATTTVTTGITVNSNGGTEARPRNIAFLPCIKY